MWIYSCVGVFEEGAPEGDDEKFFRQANRFRLLGLLDSQVSFLGGRAAACPF
jgi:hypothetical protein